MKEFALRVIGVLCAAAMLLTAAGCNTRAEEPTDPVRGSSEASVQTEPSESVPIDEYFDFSSIPYPALYTDEPIMQADPNREVYISLSNQDFDLYPGDVMPSIYFDIFTKAELDSQDVSISMDCETPYTAKLGEVSDGIDAAFRRIGYDAETKNYDSYGQQPYHYLCMKGVDLRELSYIAKKSELAWQILRELVNSQNISGDDHTYCMNKYAMPYQKLYQQYLEEYKAQGDTILTDYHVYHIFISFEHDKFHDETIERLELRLGDQTYPIEFGQWRLHSGAPEEATANAKGISMGTKAILASNFDSPYLGGYLNMEGSLRFTVTQQVAISGFRWSGGGEAEILGCRISYALGGEGSSSEDYYWDCTQPLFLEAGQKPELSIILYSESLKQYEAAIGGLLYMDYVLTETGEACTVAIPCMFMRMNPLWDTYCLAFLGVDVGEYYHYFFDNEPFMSWFNAIPESWKAKHGA